MSTISRSGCWLEVDLAHEGRPNFGLEKIEKNNVLLFVVFRHFAIKMTKMYLRV
jgi:hypothetical protein